MKKGLVLEGGAMRGMFTAGVMDVLMENEISFDGTIGVSAGAVFGYNMKSRQIGRVIRYNTRFARDPRYCSIRSLIKTGDLYGADFCYKTLPEELDVFDTETYRNNPMVFYVAATDALTGKAVYKQVDEGCGKDLLWFRASASMPLVSRPVEIDGGFYLDGGISDSIPLEFMEKQGYEKNLVILTQADGYRKKPASKALFGFSLRKFPALREAMYNRHIMYNRELDYVSESEKDGRAFVIRPESKLEIGKTEHNPDVMRRVYEQGRAAAEARLAQIKKFLS